MIPSGAPGAAAAIRDVVGGIVVTRAICVAIVSVPGIGSRKVRGEWKIIGGMCADRKPVRALRGQPRD